MAAFQRHATTKAYALILARLILEIGTVCVLEDAESSFCEIQMFDAVYSMTAAIRMVAEVQIPRSYSLEALNFWPKSSLLWGPKTSRAALAKSIAGERSM